MVFLFLSVFWALGMSGVHVPSLYYGDAHMPFAKTIIMIASQRKYSMYCIEVPGNRIATCVLYIGTYCILMRCCLMSGSRTKPRRTLEGMLAQFFFSESRSTRLLAFAGAFLIFVGVCGGQSLILMTSERSPCCCPLPVHSPCNPSVPDPCNGSALATTVLQSHPGADEIGA